MTAAILVLAGCRIAVAQSQSSPSSQSGVGLAAGSTGAVGASVETTRNVPDGPIPGKISRYAHRVIARHDRNGDGELAKDEWSTMAGNPRQADLDGDGAITHQEFAWYVVRFGRRRSIRLAPPSPEQLDWFPSLLEPGEETPALETSAQQEPPGRARQAAPGLAAESESRIPAPGRFHVPSTRLPDGLPNWFLLRDADGDRQITLAEFASSAKATETEIRTFQRTDTNSDGLITADECLRGTPPTSEEKQPAQTAQDSGTP